MPTVNCPECDQPYALVLSARKAHPGRRTAPRPSLVPAQGVHGETLDAKPMTDRWVSDGPSSSVHVSDDRKSGTVTWSWGCLCGMDVEWEAPVVETVPCRHGATTPEGVCSVRRNHLNPPDDYYVNPRHGAACPCCGHQGTHLVQRGQAPACHLPK